MLRQLKAMLLEKRIGKKTDEGNASGKDNREEDYLDKDCTVDHDDEMPGEINAKFSASDIKSGCAPIPVLTMQKFKDVMPSR